MPDLGWYINRLRPMSAQEVGFRICRKVMDFVERFPWYQTLKLHQVMKEDASKGMFKGRLRELFPFQLNKEFLDQDRCNMVNLASRQNKSKVSFAVFEGSIDSTIPDNDWHMDPKTGKRWPLIYSGSISTRDTRNVGEVDYVWRVNRCQHLIPLAQSSLLNSDSEVERLVRNQIHRWIQANPYLTGVNWTSSMELAIRCISWVIALSFLAQDENFLGKDIEDIITSIKLQMDYIDNHLSRYSSANNHIIAELTGLITIGLIFKDYPKGQEQLQKGLTELTKEVDRQIYPDGVDKEQSIHYHSFVLDCLLWIIVTGKRGGIDIPEVIQRRAEDMCGFIAALMDEGGHLPAIGDSDDGYVIWLADMTKLNNYRSQLATGAVLFNRPDFKALAKEFDEKSLWLLGAEGYKSFETLENTSADRGSLSFPDSGYYVLGSGRGEIEKLLLFDCGPLGYPSTAAHGHADVLSIWLSVGGHPVLIDSGTYSYLAHPEWRDYFGGTAAHNTVVVNGHDQSVAGGPYIWINHARAHCDTWYTSSSFDYVAGSHDGYSRRHKVTHKRRILFVKPDYWIVEDLLEGVNPFDAQAFFHFSHGETTLSKTDAHYLFKFTNQSGGSGVQILLPFRKETEVSIVRGDESTMQGWISPKYGYKTASSALSIAAKAKGKYRIGYILIPTAANLTERSRSRGPFDFEVSSSLKPGYELFNLSSKEGQGDIYFMSPQGTVLKMDKLEIRGETILLRCNQLGVVQAVFIIGLSWAQWKGKTINVSLIPKSFCVLQAIDDSLSTTPLGFDERLQTIKRTEVLLHSF